MSLKNFKGKDGTKVGQKGKKERIVQETVKSLNAEGKEKGKKKKKKKRSD